MQEFRHNDFSIGFPEGWMDASVVVTAGPPNDGYSPSITITRERLRIQLNSTGYASTQLAVLEEELKQEGYQVIDEGAFQLGSLSAYRRTHIFKMSDTGASLTQLQVYVVKGKEAITITCSNLSEWFEHTNPTFLDAVKKFRWTSSTS